MDKFFSHQQDLDDILNSSGAALNYFKDQKVTIFGGTGFLGRWLVFALIEANIQLSLGIRLELVTTNVSRANSMFGDLNHELLNIIDFQKYKSEAGYSNFVFHGATPTTNSEKSILASNNNPVIIADEIVRIARLNANKPTVLHLNSGAIYGEQSLSNINQEETLNVTLTPGNLYTKTKLEIDDVFNYASKENLINYKSPRLYAFAGPHLPLEEHFAIGNFVSSSFLGKPIVIHGNSITTRSYLYPTDLVHCLLQMSVIESDAIFNIGSDIPISMLSLAEKVSTIVGSVPIIQSGDDKQPSNYVPSITNLRKYVTDKPFIPIDEILVRWSKWLKH
jgi:nucleoside-diphosphate-sugar epimerase